MMAWALFTFEDWLMREHVRLGPKTSAEADMSLVLVEALYALLS